MSTEPRGKSRASAHRKQQEPLYENKTSIRDLQILYNGIFMIKVLFVSV